MARNYFPLSWNKCVDRQNDNLRKRHLALFAVFHKSSQQSTPAQRLLVMISQGQSANDATLQNVINIINLLKPRPNLFK